MSIRVASVALLAALVLCPSAASTADERSFPASLTVTENGADRHLLLTGTTRRIFIVFEVYEIAHYAEPIAGRPRLSLANVVADGPAKAIVITFARRLDRDRIREELARSLERNAEPGWVEQARPAIESFTEAIDRDAEKGDQLIFYWFSGGRFHAEFNGERLFSVTDTIFAKLIWSIWFGSDPVVDRAELLAREAPQPLP